jgi:phosphoribosylglycinamide formyltransferase-1
VGEFQRGAGQILGKGAKRLTRCIPASDRTDQLLQRAGAPQLLKVTHQGQLTAGVRTPAEPCALGQLHAQAHGLALIGETAQFATAQHREIQILKRLNQHILIAKDGWQDGEMGHGPTPDPLNPSEPDRSIQWPLPPDRPTAGSRPLRLGVMASGSGSNFEALVAACQDGRLAATVCQLVVNNPGCGAEQRARRLGVPCTLHDHRNHATREALDQALIASFRAAEVDLVVMAGWMRIVTQSLIDTYPERLINIHPSLLPSFRGARAIDQALAAGVQLSGCTAHLVSLEVDTGPILVQAAVPVLADDSVASLAARIHAQEHRILPLAVQLAAERLDLLRDRRAAAAGLSQPADPPSG